MTTRQKLWRLYGWVFVRPRRRLFSRMVWASCPQLFAVREPWGVCADNAHWWPLYIAVFQFFKWLYYDAWRPFCKWDKWLIHKPWYAALIQRIGATTAGYAIGGGECFHCASKDGDPVDLSDDDTGTTFRLLETWSVPTGEGTDHRFRGITICPVCGYEDEFEDGSL